MNQDKIGKFIAKCRKEKKLTQLELAEKLGVTDKSISNWENGKNMPDVSLYKHLCQILEISIDEFINGERVTKDNQKISTEKAIINTIKVTEKEKKHMKKIIKILIILIIISSLTFLILINKYKFKKSEISSFSIKNLKVVKSENEKQQSIIRQNSYNIYLYGIKELLVIDTNNNSFDFKKLLKSKKINVNSLKKYLRNAYKDSKILRYTKNNGQVQIYDGFDYSIILCDTNEGNKDIYIGTSNLDDNLNGNYCGYNSNCYFTKNYIVVNVDSHDNKLNKVTLQEDEDIQTITISNKYNLEVGKEYGFSFSTNKEIANDIKSIFESAKLLEVNNSNKIIYKQTLNSCNDKIRSYK